MSDIETTLLLDAEAVAAGERYSAERGTTLSHLVSDFLRHLPSDAPDPPLPKISNPEIRRLYGIAAGGQVDEADYKEYLWRKYGGA